MHGNTSSLNLDFPTLHLKCISLFCTLISFYTEFTFTASGWFPTPDGAETHTHYIFCLFCISVLLASAQTALRDEKQRRKTYKTTNMKVVLITWFREKKNSSFELNLVVFLHLFSCSPNECVNRRTLTRRE